MAKIVGVPEIETQMSRAKGRFTLESVTKLSATQRIRGRTRENEINRSRNQKCTASKGCRAL